MGSAQHEQKSPNVPFGEAVWTWVRVACLSFGGPAGQIAVMHRILVEEKRWVSENRFLHALNYCMLLPGPEAQQLATYIGWLLHGTRGGLVAGTLFVLPGFVAILVLSMLYAGYYESSILQGLLFGLKPAIVAVVAEAVARIGRRALKNRVMAALAAAAFVAIFFFQVPFPWIVISAGLVGFLGGRYWPEQFVVIKGHAVPPDGEVEHAVADAHDSGVRPTWGRALRVAGVWLALWWGPIAVLAAVTGPRSVFTTQALFFSKVAVVTFGGAYAVLAYVAEEAVSRFDWLRPGEMLDGLGMAETTPGPLIMVLEFVGYLAAYRNPGDLPPVAAGILGAVITTWVTFAPCFLWIFLGAPYIEALRGRATLNAALSAITAAVVGVVLNLSIWFAVHALFGTVETRYVGDARFLVPELWTLNVVSALLTAGAALAIFRFHAGMIKTLAVCTAFGLAYTLLTR